MPLGGFEVLEARKVVKSVAGCFVAETVSWNNEVLRWVKSKESDARTSAKSDPRWPKDAVWISPFFLGLS